jgi:hypothetical protein
MARAAANLAPALARKHATFTRTRSGQDFFETSRRVCRESCNVVVVVSPSIIRSDIFFAGKSRQFITLNGDTGPCAKKSSEVDRQVGTRQPHAWPAR